MFEHLATWFPDQSAPEDFNLRVEVNGAQRSVRRVCAWCINGDENVTPRRKKDIALSHDSDGRFYAEEWVNEGGETIAHTLSVVRPDQALAFILSRMLNPGPFLESLREELKAIQPPVKAKRKRKETAKQPLLG